MNLFVLIRQAPTGFEYRLRNAAKSRNKRQIVATRWVA